MMAKNFPNKGRRGCRTNRRSGQSAVEFALAVPFLLFAIVTVLYFGRYFLIAQTILHAAQEGVRIASATPISLTDPNFQSTMSMLRGFATPAGGSPNINSPVYGALAAANLLSQGSTGDLPAGAQVKILPWDDQSQQLPAGTIAVRIDYPFQFLNNNFGAGGAMDTPAVSLPVYSTTPINLLNFVVTQQAVAASTVYQQYPQ